MNELNFINEVNFFITEEQFLIYLAIFAKSEGYELRQLFSDGDYKTIEILAEKMKLYFLLWLRETFNL